MCRVVDLEIKQEVRKRRNNIHTALFLNPKHIIVGGVSALYFEFSWSVLNYTVLYEGTFLLGYTSPTAQLPQHTDTDNVEHWESKADVHRPGFQAKRSPGHRGFLRQSEAKGGEGESSSVNLQRGQSLHPAWQRKTCNGVESVPQSLASKQTRPPGRKYGGSEAWCS